MLSRHIPSNTHFRPSSSPPAPPPFFANFSLSFPFFPCPSLSVPPPRFYRVHPEAQNNVGKSCMERVIFARSHATAKPVTSIQVTSTNAPTPPSSTPAPAFAPLPFLSPFLHQPLHGSAWANIIGCPTATPPPTPPAPPAAPLLAPVAIKMARTDASPPPPRRPGWGPFW